MTIDRFEGDYAVIEIDENDNPKNITILRNLLPAEAKEGDVMIERGGIYEIDADAADKKRREILEKMKKLRFKK